MLGRLGFGLSLMLTGDVFGVRAFLSWKMLSQTFTLANSSSLNCLITLLSPISMYSDPHGETLSAVNYSSHNQTTNNGYESLIPCLSVFKVLFSIALDLCKNKDQLTGLHIYQNMDTGFWCGREY